MKLFLIALIATLNMLQLSQVSIAVQPSVPVLTDSELVYWRPGGLWVFNQATLEETFWFAYDPPIEGSFNSLEIDRARHRFYVLENDKKNNDFKNAQGRIIQFDLDSGDQQVIYEGLNLTTFAISPDKTQMIVRAHREYTSGRPQDIVFTQCLLTIDTGECEDFTDTLPRNELAFWFSDHTLYYSQGDIYVTNSETMEWELLELPQIADWEWVSSFEFLPDGNLFGIAYPKTDSSTKYFIKVDFDTAEVTPLVVKPHFDHVGELSPNGRYLIHKSDPQNISGRYWGNWEYLIELIDLQTGETYSTSLVNLRIPFKWFPNSQGAIGVTQLPGNPDLAYIEPLPHHQIVYLDAANMTAHFSKLYRAPRFQPVWIISQD